MIDIKSRTIIPLPFMLIVAVLTYSTIEDCIKCYIDGKYMPTLQIVLTVLAIVLLFIMVGMV